MTGPYYSTEITQIRKQVQQLLRSRQRVTIGIDGCGAAGKSTFARELLETFQNAVIVSMDDFYLPSQERNQLSVNKPIGWQFDWQRLEREVLRPLTQGSKATYQRYNWDSDRLAEWCAIDEGKIVIIEGVYALRRELAMYYSLRIWIDCPRELRLKRGLDRDGEQNVWETTTVSAGIDYTFTISNVPIKPGTVIIGGYTRADSYPLRLYDNGSGGIVGYDRWTSVIVNAGTIDYASGLVTVNSNSNLLEWTNATVSYQPAESSPRTIAITNGQFSDTFEREAVRIYKIQKSKQIVTDTELPREFTVSQNYPNPFNPSTKINYFVATKENVKLVIYDLLGRQIRTLVDGMVAASPKASPGMEEIHKEKQ
jgi:uridine kinase